MKVYGSTICIDCRNYLVLQKSRGFAAEFIDITANTDNLKAFLRLRDTAPLFAAVRENGGIGIPLFVRDGSAGDADEMTLSLDTALAWLGQPPAAESELPEARPAE